MPSTPRAAIRNAPPSKNSSLDSWQKKLVRRGKDEANWLFQASVARDDLIGGELRRVADRLSGHSMTPLLTCLVENGELTSKERAHLRKLFDEKPRQ